MRGSDGGDAHVSHEFVVAFSFSQAGVDYPCSSSIDFATLRVQKVKDLLLKTTKFSQESPLPVEIGTFNNLLQIETKAVISNASMHQNKLMHSCHGEE